MSSKVEQLLEEAASLSTKFKEGGEETDINGAIIIDRKALDLCSPEHSKRFAVLKQLEQHLVLRYNLLGEIADVEDAIVLSRDALAHCPPGHSDHITALSSLPVLLFLRYKHTGGIDDVHEAIVLGRKALALHPPEHPGRPATALNLSLCLFMRYQGLGEMSDLSKAIILARDVAVLCPQGHPERPLCLHLLASCLHTRFMRLGIGDLEEATVLSQEALELCPTGHYLRSNCLNNFSLYLSYRYEQLGEIDDLSKAITLVREALVIYSLKNPLRSMALSNLGSYLLMRYDRLEGIDDLDEAITVTRSAVELRSPGSPGLNVPLSGLGNALLIRFRKLRRINDLNEAIDIIRDVLSLQPPGNPDRPSSLASLAVLISCRYEHLWMFDDLNEATDLSRESLALLPQGDQSRPTYLDNLSTYLAHRYVKSGEIVDLDEAISLARDALILRPPGHVGRPISLDNLVTYLFMRFRKLGDVGDRDEAFNIYGQLRHVSNAVSSAEYLFAAKSWIKKAEYFHHSTTLLAYETTLRLMVEHLAALPPLPHHLSILKDHTSSLAADAFSACLRNQAAIKAVELLEQGRGVFWSQLTRLRSPLHDVIASGPDGKKLADEFTRVTSLIRTALDSPGEDQHERVFRLNVELRKIVSSIRQLPDFPRFLLPPLFSDLQSAASGGPIIIVNASEYGCDALVVFSDRDPVHIPIPVTKQDVRRLSSRLRSLTKLAQSTDMTRDMKSFLRELWDAVVSHIIDFLVTAYPPQSRIWWCPTAEFSLLPLHAATPYRTGQKGASDLYISSYTPTLMALIRARRVNSLNPAAKRHFVAIGEASAIGINQLYSVGTELATIGRLVDGVATFTPMEGADSSISRVIEELGKNEWVHLACHGVPDRRQPFESALKLHDGNFTVRHIIQSNLTNAEFAYLSACYTTVGDEESPDEVIHLASAMQFAGFRSVIGTMWAVDDAETNKVTSKFYKYMVDESGQLDHTRAAAALRKTMKSVNMPIDQRILYVHLGA